MTLVDAFQLLPLGVLGVKIAPGSTQCFLRSTDGPLKPTKDYLSIDRYRILSSRQRAYPDRKMALRDQHMDFSGQHKALSCQRKALSG